MPKPKKISKHTHLVRGLISFAVLIVAVLIVVRNWSVVTNSFDAARSGNSAWFALAIVLSVLTFCIAAAIYVTLALHPLRYGQTVLIEASTAFVNRLLPSGIGGLGVHGLYLYRRKHTAAEATAVVSANNLLGLVAHLFLLATVAVCAPTTFTTLQHHYKLAFPVWALYVLPAILFCAWAIRPLRQRLHLFTANLFKSVKSIGLPHITRALLLAMLLTATYTTTLFVCATAVGLQLSEAQIFIIFSIGMFAGTATPTPGGLVGMEAGLFAGFVGYGTNSASAGAAVLLYRLATYWLPLLPGLAALGLARRRKLL